MSAWINPETLTGDGAIVGIAVGGATPQSSSRFSILASGDNVRVFARSTDSTAAEVDVVTTTSPLTTGSWHYVTAVVDYANDSVDIYVDGVLTPISEFGKTHNAGSIISPEIWCSVKTDKAWDWFPKKDILVVVCTLDTDIDDGVLISYNHLAFTKYDENNMRSARIKKNHLEKYKVKS